MPGDVCFRLTIDCFASKEKWVGVLVRRAVQPWPGTGILSFGCFEHMNGIRGRNKYPWRGAAAAGGNYGSVSPCLKTERAKWSKTTANIYGKRHGRVVG